MMKDRRPLFLLEIVIALVLVGMFAMGFLGSGARYVTQERKALLELEFERQKDLFRMEVISACWKEIQDFDEPVDVKDWSFDKTLQTKLGQRDYKEVYRLKVNCKKVKEAYDLVLIEGIKRYHFLVTKSSAFAK